jgi:predicted HTH domain antitoxin
MTVPFPSDSRGTERSSGSKRSHHDVRFDELSTPNADLTPNAAGPGVFGRRTMSSIDYLDRIAIDYRSHSQQRMSEALLDVRTIRIEIPDSLTPLEWGSDEAFASELRLAAAIQWYSQGLISQGRAAEIAGLDRTSFLLALGRAKVDAFQIIAEELTEEVERAMKARHQRLAGDLP